MIVRSRIRQSFRSTHGFVLERGDNKFAEPLPAPVARTLEILRKAGYITILTDEEYAADQAPALALPPAATASDDDEDEVLEADVAAASADDGHQEQPKRRRKKRRQ